MLAVYLKRIAIGLRMLPPFCFAWMAMWMTYHPLKQRAARKRLTAAGQSLGLRHEIAELRSEYGALEGAIDGRRVTIEPDEGLIHVYLRPRCPGDLVDIVTGKCYTNTPAGQVDVTIPVPGASRVFGTCRVQRQLEDAWNRSTELHATLTRFVQRYGWSLASLRINSCLVTAEFGYGYPFNRYLPAERLGELLTSVNELAQHLEPLVSPYQFRD